MAAQRTAEADSRSAAAELDAQLADLEIEIEESTLKAPFAGVITKRHVHEGMVLAPGLPVVRLVERDSLEVRLGLPAEIAAELSTGQTHIMQVSGNAFEGRLTAKLPELDRTSRTRAVLFTLDPAASAQVLPGELATIELRRRVQSPGCWLPISSLTRETRGLWSVFAIQTDPAGEQHISRRYVEVIHLEDNRAWVRGTLDAGELVIADGTHRVVPGQQVVASESSPASNPESDRIDRGPQR
jgi:RND family efflux transporter MFP subunit